MGSRSFTSAADASANVPWRIGPWLAVPPALATVLWLALTLGCPLPPSDQQPRHEGYADSRGQQYDPDALACLLTPETAHAQAGAQPEQGGTWEKICRRREKFSPEGVMGLLTFVIAWATCAYAVTASRQLHAMNLQAKATEAQLSMTARLERPWVLVDVQCLVQKSRDPDFGAKPGQPVDVQAAFMAIERITQVHCHWTIANHGRSPAWIHSVAAELRWADYHLPAEPTYGDHVPFHDMPITADKSHGHSDSLVITRDDFFRLLKLERSIVFYGVAYYRDATGTLHTTRFCYRWFCQPLAPFIDPDKSENISLCFYPGGPPAWIEHT